MIKWSISWMLLSLCSIYSTQYLDVKLQNGTVRICRTIVSYDLKMLNTLKGCVVVLGNLKVVLIEQLHNLDGISFPELREITGYLLVYRVRGLKSLGQLFPGLARIRGSELFMNYALIVHDMTSLQEIGLYNLIKIDRGGVIIYAQPTTCFLDTVDWHTIAPNVRHVISQDSVEGSFRGVECTTSCTCTQNYTTNHCWNNRKCQRFLEGPDGETCHEQCLGCRKTRRDICTVCRHYTHEGRCVQFCPNNTYVVEINRYCLTMQQCYGLKGWLFNNTCVLNCPFDYKMQNNSGVVTCEPCEHCAETCENIYITSLDAMQDAQRCVYINGSLTIHVRAITEAMKELRISLSRLKEVNDYILIYGSLTITSLDFFSSLVRIGGRNLKNGAYSFVIYDMINLQTLLSANVIKNLKINAGTARIYDNPILCKKEIDKIRHLFPQKPNEINVPAGKNGYSGSCTQVDLGLRVKEIDANSALITFFRDSKHSVTYSVLYMRLLPGQTSDIVPESCSDTEWYAVKVLSLQADVSVSLSDLKPASKYILCIETYDSDVRQLTRSSIITFTTKVGRPAPPFLTELVAPSPNSIVIHWVNHRDYTSYITHYELEVVIADISDDDVNVRNQCDDAVTQDIVNDNYEYSPHAVVKRPPDEYEKACETMCGILSSGIVGAMVQDDFDPCTLGLECEDIEESSIADNSTFGKHNYFNAISVRINGSKKEYQIGGLAPYRDYRVRLRACTNQDCSRFNRRRVRTKALRDADLARILTVIACDGKVTVKWEAPAIPNGQVLSYTVQVKPKRKYPEIGFQISQDVCVLNKYRSATVQTIATDSYLVRVCTTSMAPDSTCTDWKKVNIISDDWHWWWKCLVGVFGAVIICIMSYCSQKYCDCFKPSLGDEIPLVDRANSEESITTMYSFRNPFLKNNTVSRSTNTASSLSSFSNPIPRPTKKTPELEMNTFSITSENPFLEPIFNIKANRGININHSSLSTDLSDPEPGFAKNPHTDSSSFSSTTKDLLKVQTKY